MPRKKVKDMDKKQQRAVFWSIHNRPANQRRGAKKKATKKSSVKHTKKTNKPTRYQGYKQEIMNAYKKPNRAYEDLGMIKTALNFDDKLPKAEKDKLYALLKQEKSRLEKDQEFVAKRQMMIANSINKSNQDNPKVKEYLKKIDDSEDKPASAFSELMSIRNSVNFDQTLTAKEKDDILQQVERKEQILASDKSFMAKRQTLISESLKGGSLKQKEETRIKEEKIKKMEKFIAELENMDTAGKLNITNPIERQIVNNFNTNDSSKKDNQVLLAILQKKKNELSKDKTDENEHFIRNLNMIIDGVERTEGVKAIPQSELKKIDLEKHFSKFLDQKPKRAKKQEYLIKVSKDDISKELAERSFYNTSHSPERRGESARQAYVDHINAFQKEMMLKVPESEHDKLKIDLKVYQERYKAKIEDQLHRHSRIASSFITGGSNFPVRQMEKRNDVYDRKQKELFEWVGKAQKRIARKYGIGKSSAISSDDSDAITKIETKIKKLEARQEFMKEVNKVVRSKKLTEKQKVDKLEQDFKVKKSVAIEFLKPDFAGRKGFPSYELSNNNQNINRLRKRVKSLTAMRSQKTSKKTIKGVEIIDNVEANRLQLVFDGKPSAEIRKKLKSRGFRWSPSNMAWQRQRSSGANYDAEQILESYGGE